MVRKSKKKEEAEAPLVQLGEYCFNIFGHGFYHGIENRVENQVITTYGVSSKSYNTRTTELGAGARSRPSLEATEREKQDAKPPHTIQCVVIGLAPSEVDLDYIGKTPKEFKLRGKAVGTQEPAEALEYSREITPYRVVAEVTDAEPAGGTKLYVLMDEEQGLSHPYNIAQKEVFYFAEFRDMTSTKEGRKTAWNELVKKVSVIEALDTDAPDGVKFKRSRERTVLTLTPTESFINEIRLLVSAFAMHREPWMLGKLRDVLELANEDLDAQMPTNEKLHTFMTLKLLPDEDEAKELISEIANMWPEVDINDSEVMVLKKALVDEDLELDYRLLRGFLIYGATRIRRGEQILAQELIDTTEKVIGPVVPPRTSIQQDHAGSLLAAVTKKLKEISKVSAESNKAIQDLNGDQAIVDGLMDVFETFKNAADIDTAKLAFHQGLRFGFGAITQKNDVTKGMLDKLIEVLEHIGLPDVV